MGHTARLRIIRDRFVAGHDSCALRRHLDCVPPETPIRDIVDRCRVWESHADTEARRFSKPGPERALPIYTVNEPGCGLDDRMVVTVTVPSVVLDQLETLLRPKVGKSVTAITGGSAGVIGSDVPWLECPACNALTWVITVTNKPVWCQYDLYGKLTCRAI